MNSPDMQSAAPDLPAAANVTYLDFADPSFFYDLFWHSPEAMAVGNPDSATFGPVNPAYARMHGYEPGELDGQLIACVYPPECREELRTGVVATNLTGFLEWETLHQRKDGSIFPVSMKVRAIYGAQGQVRFRITSAQDITERKRVQAELERSRQQLQAIAESIPDALQVYDLVQERSIFTNRGVGPLLGYAPDDLPAMGQNINRTLLHPDDYDRVQADDLTYRSLPDGEIFEHSFRMRHKNGAYRWLRSRGAAFERDADGRVTHIIATATDITDQREQQARIEDLNIRLRRAMQETHHRVKNNLQVIASLAEMQIDAHAIKAMEQARSEADSAAEQAIIGLRRIAQHIHSLAALHDLLTHNATLDESAGVVAARALLKKLLPLLQPLDGVRRLRSRVDEIRFSSRTAAPFALLVNELVSNALKHGQGDIMVILRQNDTMACLEVRDQGPGFGAEFDPQRAAHTGLELIDSLVRYDLHGQVAYVNAADADAAQGWDSRDADLPSGGRVVVTFPIVSPVLVGC